MKKLKIVFLGTPKLVVNCLEVLDKRHNVLCVVSQPSEMTKKGLIKPPAIIKAEELRIQIFQPKNISRDGGEYLRSLNADLFITFAYGQMLKQNILDIAPVFNIHPSLLPKYRGASPIQSAILNGDTKTGVTIAKTELGMDCGDIILQEECKILETDDAISLEEKLGDLGTDLILKAIEQFADNTITYTKQNEADVTMCKKFENEDNFINFRKSAIEVVNLVRALTGYCYLGDKRLIIKKCKLIEERFSMGKFEAVGECIVENKQWFVNTKGGFIELLEVQLEGKKEMTVKDFLNGFKLEDGTVLRGRE